MKRGTKAKWALSFWVWQVLWADPKWFFFFFGLIFRSPNRNPAVCTILISVALFSFPHRYPASYGLFVIPRSSWLSVIREDICSTSFVEDTSVVEAGWPFKRRKIKKDRFTFCGIFLPFTYIRGPEQALFCYIDNYKTFKLTLKLHVEKTGEPKAWREVSTSCWVSIGDSLRNLC